MKKLLLLSLLLCAFSAQAAPFLVSDADVTGLADVCVMQEGAGTPVESPLVNKACKIDLASVSTGNHAVNVYFKNSLWGTQSAATPFTFARPGSISSPATIRLVP